MNEDHAIFFRLPGDDVRRSGRRTGGLSARTPAVTVCNGEIWGAVTAVAAVAAVGVSAASAYSNAKNQKAALEAQSHQPGVTPATFEDPSQSYEDYYKSVSDNYGQLSDLAQRQTDVDNLSYRRSVGQVDSKLASNIQKQGEVTDAYLHARVPQDVRDETTRSDAYQALLGGYGSDSGAAHALKSRDFGLDSLKFQQIGNQMLSSELANDKSLTPFTITPDSLLLTPKELLSRQDSNDAYENAVFNKNKQIQYSNSLAATGASTYSPTAAAVSSGIGSIGGAANALGTYFKSNGSTNSAGNGDAFTYGSNNYDATSAAAGTSGYYSPYLDESNFDAEGNFVGNANSFGSTGG